VQHCPRRSPRRRTLVLRRRGPRDIVANRTHREFPGRYITCCMGSRSHRSKVRAGAISLEGVVVAHLREGINRGYPRLTTLNIGAKPLHVPSPGCQASVLRGHAESASGLPVGGDRPRIRATRSRLGRASKPPRSRRLAQLRQFCVPHVRKTGAYWRVSRVLTSPRPGESRRRFVSPVAHSGVSRRAFVCRKQP